MRIAIVTPYPPSLGTLNEYAYHFVRALRAKPEVDEVIILADELPDGQAYAGEPAQDGRAALTIVPCWRFNAANNAYRILQVLRNTKPDLVLFNIQFASFGRGKIPATLGLSAPWLAKRAGFPTIVLLHNIMETVDLKSAGFETNALMERIIRSAGTAATRMVLSADRVALTIPKYVEIVNDKYGADNVVLAPHGSFDEETTLPDLDLPDGPLQIMAFGKFGTYKKVELMIEAARLLEAQGVGPLEVVIAGTDSPNAAGYLDGVRARYADMPNLRFTGYVAEAEVPGIFKAAAVVVFPYTSTTGSSGVLHQAGSYGKAAVLPRIGDFAEVIAEEGYDGEFFVPDDVASLAQAIQNVITNPERRRELGMRNFWASRGLPISDVVDWYLLHFEAIKQGKEIV
ncbi:MAG: glycosyltransferase [Caldilineaceae bacterium]|nr:glycosyltransferase [Caldilineaceae bacterium]